MSSPTSSTFVPITTPGPPQGGPPFGYPPGPPGYGYPPGQPPSDGTMYTVILTVAIIIIICYCCWYCCCCISSSSPFVFGQPVTKENK